ncbi:MAG: CPBP family intramembrane metalloprotease [Acidobacteriaceae bacterium]|nr:CPBP family intramembrane metalloprotease [Acidobacteriaceae bacterium]
MPVENSTQPPASTGALVVHAGAAIVWFALAAMIAERVALELVNRFSPNQFSLAGLQPLLAALILLFLLIVGFSTLASISHHPRSMGEILGLPQRATARNEWLLGAAIGWGMAIIAVLPLLIARAFFVGFRTDSLAFTLIPFNLAAVAAVTLAEEITFRGTPFRNLINALGAARATIVMAILYALFHTIWGNGRLSAFLITFLAGVVLALGWLRTHGLWLPWGLHFAWNASIGILFGLPVTGNVDASTVIQSTAYGRNWLTGGAFGPEGGVVAVLALLVGMVVLLQTTRDYAWNYTHPEIIAAGYPMEPPPPPAHSAFVGDPLDPLIQIHPRTPESRPPGQEP